MKRKQDLAKIFVIQLALRLWKIAEESFRKCRFKVEIGLDYNLNCDLYVSLPLCIWAWK